MPYEMHSLIDFTNDTFRGNYFYFGKYNFYVIDNIRKWYIVGHFCTMKHKNIMFSYVTKIMWASVSIFKYTSSEIQDVFTHLIINCSTLKREYNGFYLILEEPFCIVEKNTTEDEEVSLSLLTKFVIDWC